MAVFFELHLISAFRFIAGSGSFFSAFARVFTGIHEEEETAKCGNHYRPGFGNATSDAAVVSTFYKYWLGFKSTRSFSSFGKWNPDEAPNRVVRQLMQQKNRIDKEKARNQYNEQVFPQLLCPYGVCFF